MELKTTITMSLEILILKDSIDFKYQGHQVISGTKEGQRVFSADYKMMGNMSIKILNGDTTTFQYNSQNRLASATKGGNTNQFVYNHLGQRVLKINGDGSKVLYVNTYYEESTNSAKKSFTTKYIVGPNGKMAAITEKSAQSASSNNSLFFHQNHLASTVLVTDNSGTVKNRPVYLPYGSIFTLNGTSDFRPKYTGKELDDDLGIYYYDARYYDPSIGRFITADNNMGGHKSQQDVFNRYEYVLGNPVKFIDPSGNISCTASGVSFGIVGGLSGGILLAGGGGFGGSKLAESINQKSLSTVFAGIGASAGFISGGLGGGLTTAKGVYEFCMKRKERREQRNENDENNENDEPDAEEDGDGEMGERSSDSEIDEDAARVARRITRRALRRARERRGCFTSGTLISTKTGYVIIENIAVGDSVWSYNTANNNIELKPVVRLLPRQVDSLVIISINGKVIETTAEHPFWIVCQGWVEAINLKTGDHLLSATGEVSSIDSISYQAGNFPVFNFEVKDNHNYYVSNDSYLVHNNCENNDNDSGSNEGTEGEATNADDAAGTGAEGEAQAESATQVAGESAGEVVGETTGEVAGEVAGEVVGEVAAAGFIESVLLPVLESLAFLLIL